MRRAAIQILSLALVFIAGCGKKADPGTSAPDVQPSQTLSIETLLHIRFDGTEKLFAGTNASFLKEIWSLPETDEFRNRVLEKMARAPFRFYQQHISGTNDFAGAIRGLLDDVLRFESFVELHGTNAQPEFVFAIRLPAGRAEFWSTNLATILQTWTGIGIAQDKTGIWELKKHHAPNLFRFSRAGEWVVLGIGQDELPFQSGIVAAIVKNGRPVAANASSWLEVAGDWSRIERWLKLPETVAGKQFHLSISSVGENSKTRFTLTSADKYDLQLEPWRVPTNTIYEPLISFTAVRGVRPYLERLPAVRKYGLQPAPNQLYFWALNSQIPVQSYAMTACDNASNTLKRIAPKLISSLSSNLFRRQVGKIAWTTDESALIWKDIVPIIAPFVQPMKEPSGEFLFAGLFPRSPHEKTVPGELLAELTSKTNLVYYDLEFTGPRILQWMNLAQLPDLVRGRNLFRFSPVAEKFLLALKQRCGNTITEITVEKPNELRFERKSNIGLTAVELVALAYWLDATNFPAFGRHVPPHRASTNQPPTNP